jgi:Phage integrase family
MQAALADHPAPWAVAAQLLKGRGGRCLALHAGEHGAIRTSRTAPWVASRCVENALYVEHLRAARVPDLFSSQPTVTYRPQCGFFQRIDIAAMEIPVLPDLQRVIDASPTGDLTFLVSEWKRPFAVSAFGNWFRTRSDEAGLPQCSAHGLRKAGATIAAENGATEHQLMAIFGWATSKEAERYTKTAQRKKMAGEAMSLLVRPKDEQKVSHCEPQE